MCMSPLPKDRSNHHGVIPIVVGVVLKWASHLFLKPLKTRGLLSVHSSFGRGGGVVDKRPTPHLILCFLISYSLNNLHFAIDIHCCALIAIHTGHRKLLFQTKFRHVFCTASSEFPTSSCKTKSIGPRCVPLTCVFACACTQVRISPLFVL